MGQHTLEPHVAVIFNPSKPANWDDVKHIVNAQAHAAGYAEPLWIPTTKEDPGTGQTREAIARKSDLVIAAGGDGTVRLVAGELAGQKARLGILPMGTGNLFARNIGIPLDSVRDAATIAFGTSEERIDLGWVELASAKNHRSQASRRTSATHATHSHAACAPTSTPTSVPTRRDDVPPQRDSTLHFRLGRGHSQHSAHSSRHPFLVVGGVGFDAETMASTDATLKKMIGVLAYFQAAIPNLLTRKFSAIISAPNLSRPVTTAVRSVMFVNCPQLNSGIVLDPNADPADGALNLNVLDIHGGLIGWADLLRRVGMSWVGLRSRTKGVPYKKGVGGIRTHAIRRCSVHLERARKVQVDGDVIGSASTINVTVAPRAVRVRVRSSAGMA
ncbi:MAG: diacylglycerol kinase family protein [Actinomycetaceae bacterium]|nr:hypothetical protein [Arcanobacterium sp.]MDD7686939.1 diacylglycerol kinase family protein [Actinomycetaceae bacterium]MDY5273522.1 diacylglycerol kinase family protein [Arcanobacterium sp.]